MSIDPDALYENFKGYIEKCEWSMAEDAIRDAEAEAPKYFIKALRDILLTAKQDNI